MNYFFSRCKSALSFLLCLCLCASSLCLVSEQEAFATADSSGWDGEYIDFFVGYNYIMALRSNGTVAINDRDEIIRSFSLSDEQLDELLGWTDVVKLLPGFDMILGLRSNGRVLITGERSDEFSEVRDWKNVKDILGGNHQVFGLTNSGLVLTAGEFMSPGMDISEISKWRHVEQLVYGSGGYDDNSIIGLCFNGNVVGMGERWAQRGWDGSVSDAGYVYTDGWISGCIKTDGTAEIWGTNSGHTDSELAKLYPEYFETDPNSPESMYLQISRWEELRQLFFMETYAVGLKSDGSVYHTTHYDEALDESLKQLDSWSDIEKLYYRDHILLGLRADGSVKVFEPYKFYYPRHLEEEGFRQLCDEIAAWQDIADIKISGGALIGYKTDGSTVVSAPLHEEFIQADRKAAPTQ